MSLADDVAAFLAGAGLGLVAGTNLFLQDVPAQPDALVAVIEYPGRGPVGTHDDPASIEVPRFQVYARAAQYDAAAARASAEAAYKALRAVTNQTLSGTFYLAIRALQSPFLLHRDENQRVVFAVNFEATKYSVQ